MKTLYRLGYYFVGLSLGLVVVSFVLAEKKPAVIMAHKHGCLQTWPKNVYILRGGC